MIARYERPHAAIDSQILSGEFGEAGVATFVHTDRHGVMPEAGRRVCCERKADGKMLLRHEASHDSAKTWAVRLEVVLERSR